MTTLYSSKLKVSASSRFLGILGIVSRIFCFHPRLNSKCVVVLAVALYDHFANIFCNIIQLLQYIDERREICK